MFIFLFFKKRHLITILEKSGFNCLVPTPPLSTWHRDIKAKAPGEACPLGCGLQAPVKYTPLLAGSRERLLLHVH